MNTPLDQMQKPQQAQSVAIPKRFPLATRPGFRSTTLQLNDPAVRSPVSDAVLLNAYAELDPEDRQYWVQKRPGNITLATQPGAAGGVGTVFVPGFSAFPVTIFGSNLYVWTGSALSIVPYTGTHSAPLIPGRLANFVQIPPNNTIGVGHAVWAANGGLWAVFLNPGHSPAPIYDYVNSSDFITGGQPWASTPLCDGSAYLDEVLYVMDQTGAIWGSNINDLTTWVATTVIQAGGRSDFPVCLAQQMEYIIALKSTSFRCFYDAGSAANTSGVGSNLAWVEGADGNYGCANAGSVQLIDQTLVWVSNNLQSTPQVVRMDGLQVQVISTPIIERLLQQMPMGTFSALPNVTTNILYSSGLKRGGHRFYVITATVVKPGKVPFTLVYDLDQELWYIWYSNGRSYWSVCAAAADSDDTAAGVFAQDISSGSFYRLDIDQVYPSDSGTPAQVDIYTPSSDLGVRRRKMLNAMYFINDQVNGSSMQIRKSDDDYRSWSPMRTVSLSTPQPMLSRCGTFRKRALNIRHNARTPFRIKAADLQFDVGTL